MVNQPFKIALLGGTGFVGASILRRIATINRIPVEVNLLVRNTHETIRYPFVKTFSGDIYNIPTGFFPKEPHIVIHFATKNIDTDGTGFDFVNVKGTENLLKNMPDSTLGIIYGSSMSVYGQERQLSVSENTPAHPKTLLAKSRAAAEELIITAMKKRCNSAYILRPRFIIGDGDKYTIGVFKRLLNYKIRIGSGRQLFSVIDVDDYAEIILQLAKKILDGSNLPVIKALNIGYQTPISYEKIQETLCRVLEIKPPVLSVSGNVLIPILNVLPTSNARRLKTLVELLCFSHYADIKNLEAEVGGEIVLKSPLAIVEKAIVKFKSENKKW